MSELGPQRNEVAVRCDELQQIRRAQEQISMLQAQQRFALAALARKPGLVRRYVNDEIALTLRLSPAQARNRMADAELFAAFPAVAAKVETGEWLIEHADAVLDTLAGSGLSHGEQQQVLDLMISRAGRTPWELRQAVRTALVVLFPEHASERANKAAADRDVQSYVDAAGVATLLAHGPAPDVAAMMASLDALCWPPEPSDHRTAAQRRFDTLCDLVAGRIAAGNWQAQVLVALTTLQGEDSLPAEIPGFGPIPADQARQIVADGASLRRIVVDEHGRLVAVESRTHRPDLHLPDPHTPAPATEAPVTEHDRPDPQAVDEPTSDDLAWLHAQLPDHPLPDTTPPATAEPQPEPTQPEPVEPESTEPESVESEQVEPEPEPEPAPAPVAPASAELTPTLFRQPPATGQPAWSPEALGKALHWISTAPWFGIDLSTDSYVVPRRLKRFLERRDKTCIFPGCPRPAAQCDKDHLLPWPRGRTAALNLANECDAHHHAKHEYFTVTRLPDGTFRWTSPTGLHHDRPPRPVLDSWTYRKLTQDSSRDEGDEDDPPDRRA